LNPNFVKLISWYGMYRSKLVVFEWQNCIATLTNA
jgi:hypothetical protein